METTPKPRRSRTPKPPELCKTAGTYHRMTQRERERLHRLAAHWGMSGSAAINRAVELAALAAGVEPQG